MVNEHESGPKLPPSIRATLEYHWPKQFRFEGKDSDPGETETMKRVFRRGLQSFSRNVLRIMDKGVNIEQIETCLDQTVNEPGYRLMDRGQILKRLWTLAPRDPRAEVPETKELARYTPPDIVMDRRNPYAHAFREAGDDDAKAIRMSPKLGEPFGRHDRWIDTPFMRAFRAAVRASVRSEAAAARLEARRAAEAAERAQAEREDVDMEATA